MFLLYSPRLWCWCVAVSGLVIVGKLAGAAIPALLAGPTLRERTAVCVLMNTRGLVGLVILNSGLELGEFTPTLIAMV